MDTNNNKNCINFVMSSFSRVYGVDKVKINKKFYEVAKCWCNNNKIEKDKSLEYYDTYFRSLYENWQ